MTDFTQLREKSIALSTKKLQQSITPDILVIHSINSLVALNTLSNTLFEKLKEWYAIYNPEYVHAVSDPILFVQSILTKTRKELLVETSEIAIRNLPDSARSKKAISERAQEHVAGSFEMHGISNVLRNQQISNISPTVLDTNQTTSIGTDLPPQDLKPILELARAITALFETAKIQETYIEHVLQEICPNTTILAGPALTAHLLVLSGTLQKLACMPASTIQLLGAEKALFRHLKTGAKPPKYGILYNHPFVQHTPQSRKAKMARLLANKIALAVKVDYFKGQFIGDHLKKSLEHYINDTKNKPSEHIQKHTK